MSVLGFVDKLDVIYSKIKEMTNRSFYLTETDVCIVIVDVLDIGLLVVFLDVEIGPALVVRRHGFGGQVQFV